MRTAKLLRWAVRHAHVVRVNEFGEGENRPFMALTCSLAVPCRRGCLKESSSSHNRWNKGRQGLARLRADVEPEGVNWQELERTVAEQRPTLLEQASLIDRAAWQRFQAITGKP